MAAPPKITTPAQVLKYTLTHALGNGEHVGTSLYFLYTGGRPAVADCAALATLARTAWTNNLRLLFTTNGALFQITVRDIFDTAGAVGQDSTSVAGTRAGSQLTVAACAVVQYKIARSYRGGKAKGFYPFGITTDSTNGSDWLPAFITAVNTGMSAFSAAVTGGSSGTTVVSFQQSVSFFFGPQANTPTSSIWARKNIPKPRATSLQDRVTAWSCASRIGSQRRRLI